MGWAKSRTGECKITILIIKKYLIVALKSKLKHQFEELTYYSKNIWPEQIPLFENIIMSFYKSCSVIAISILQQIEISLKYSNNYFADKFNLPMALLRCNYYPPRPLKLSNKGLWNSSTHRLWLLNTIIH